MTPKERQELSNAVMLYIMDLDMSKYHKVFLANMVLERIQHPTKTMDMIARDVMKIMPSKMKDRQIVQTSVQKSLERLEAELHNSHKLEEMSEADGKDLFSGKIVKNTVLYLVNKVTE